jgi:threonine aldolase
MRQAGVLAGAGIVALTEMVSRLAEDHANAQLLAGELAGMPGITLEPERVQTNIVIFELNDPAITPKQFLTALQEQGVLMGGFGGRQIRAVTHYGITADEVRAAVAAVRAVLQG